MRYNTKVLRKMIYIFFSFCIFFLSAAKKMVAHNLEKKEGKRQVYMYIIEEVKSSRHYN